MQKKLVLFSVFLLFSVFTFSAAVFAEENDFSGGDGTPDNPYQVATAAGLDNVRHHSNAHFVQTADIDLGNSAWNEGDGWEPIGSEDNPFTGSFDAKGYVISNLMINNSTSDRIGLFGVTGEGSEIRDLGLVDVDITATGHDCGLDVGALVGRNQAEISGCYVTGSLTTMIDFDGTLRAGLMVGRNHGDISDSYAEGNVSATNLDHNVIVGGLIGQNGDGKTDNRDGGDILNSNASVTVFGKSHDNNVYAGGLIGRKGGGGDGAAGDVIDCYATGDVTADASDGGYAARAGGLIGRVGSSNDTDDGIALRSYATGNVTATGGTGAARAGGLIGQNSGWGSINGNVETCYATGDVMIIGGLYGNRVGGLIGVNFSSVYDSYAAGHVTGSPRSDLGVGEGNSLFAGGLIGQQRVEDEDRVVVGCFATGDVTVFDDVGVLVSGECGLAAGGLIGRNGGHNTKGSTISDCYAIGNVTARGDDDVTNIASGGLIGINGGRYSDTTRNSGGDVINTYAVGSVVSDDVAGALIAISDNEDGETITVQYSFANEDINPGLDLIGSVRGGVTNIDDSRLATTEQMQQQATFTDVGWDFEDTWAIKENDYPSFQMVYADIEIGHVFIQYRTYEDETKEGHHAWIEVYKHVGTIEENDITDISVTYKDTVNGELDLSGELFWTLQYYAYNCLVDPCVEFGPNVFAGFIVDFENALDEGTYAVELQTAYNQTVGKEIDYPGTLKLPMVKSASMEASFQNEDLLLQWDNPSGETNWEKVQQLRIILFDNQDDYILDIYVAPTNDSVTVPAQLLEDAESLRDTNFAAWRIQTRANDENHMNYARGLSNVKDFTIDDPPADDPPADDPPADDPPADDPPADDPPADDPPADDPEITQDNEIVESGATVANNSEHAGVVVHDGASVNNNASLSNLENHGTINGGIVSGNSKNEGTLNKVDLSPDTVLNNKGGTISGGKNEGQIFGGTFEGDITNDGVISGLSPDGELDPDYAIVVAAGASISGGTMAGKITNMGTIDNVIFEADTTIFFPHSSEGEPGTLTGTLTFMDDTGIEFVIEIPTDTVFPDPDTIPEAGLALKMQHLLDYAWDHGWFDGEEMASASLMHAENADTAMPENDSIPAIPDEYFLVGGVILSETGARSLNAAELRIPYEPWEIPEGYNEADLKALVYNYEEKKWETIPSESTGENELKISTSSITAYAVVVDDTAESDEPDSEAGSGSSSTCFVRSLF